MSRLCDVTQDGKACSNEATWFRASPWSKQLVCDAHAAEFRAAPQGGVSRIPMVKLVDLQFTCDWPGESGDGTCGAVAEYFQDHPDGYHRPLCARHAPGGAYRIRDDDGLFNDVSAPPFDPRKVPFKPPPQVPKLVGKKPITAADLGLTDKTDAYDARVDEQRQAPGARKLPEPYHFEPGDPIGLAPSMIPTTPIPPPDPPPSRVKRAFFDLATAVLDEAKRRVERWR